MTKKIFIKTRNFVKKLLQNICALANNKIKASKYKISAK